LIVSFLKRKMKKRVIERKRKKTKGFGIYFEIRFWGKSKPAVSGGQTVKTG